MIWLLILGLSGCAQVDLTAADSEVRRSTHIGFVTVYRPATDADAAIKQVRTIGLWAGHDSVGGGYKDQRDISMSPDCRVIFIINNMNQLNASIDLVASTLDLSGGEICVAE